MAIEIDKFVDLTKNDLWTSADIDNRARNILAGVVSPERQDELRTIMIGHMAQMRTATPAELQEVFKVKAYSEAIGLQIIQARIDNQLLIKIMEHEQHLKRLQEPEKTVADGFTEEEVLKDMEETAISKSIIANATPEILEWVEKRKPPVVEVPPAPELIIHPPFEPLPDPVVDDTPPVVDTPVVVDPPVDPVVPTDPSPDVPPVDVPADPVPDTPPADPVVTDPPPAETPVV